MDMSLTKPVSAEQPCGSDPEYDPEYLLLFSRAAPQAEAQYGDFVSTPEAVNWPEIERDARRLLTRSKDIRVLILLLRSRIQQAGAQGLAEMLTQLAELSVICLMHSIHSCLPAKAHPQNLLKMRRWRAVMPWRRCWITKA